MWVILGVEYIKLRDISILHWLVQMLLMSVCFENESNFWEVVFNPIQSFRSKSKFFITKYFKISLFQIVEIWKHLFFPSDLVLSLFVPRRCKWVQIKSKDMQWFSKILKFVWKFWRRENVNERSRSSRVPR